MRWLVDKYKNADTKITVFRADFSENNEHFYFRKQIS